MHTEPKTIYHALLWGGAFNDDSPVPEIIGVARGDNINLWFDSEDERSEFLAYADKVAHDCGQCLATAKYTGECAKLKTVAVMTLVEPNGDRHEFAYDFGYGYPEDAATFMFMEGNYSCDCNLSDFIAEVAGRESVDRNCGDEIKIKNFRVELR